MTHHRIITPAYSLIILLHSLAYLFYDINPFSLTYLYPYLLLFGVQIIWSSFINSKEISLIIYANFNSVFVLSSFAAIMSYYNRVSIIVILLLPLIHYFLVYVTVQYKLLDFHVELLNAFYFIVFFTSIVLLPYFVYTVNDFWVTTFFMILLFLFSLVVYHFYGNRITSKFKFNDKVDKISILYYSFFCAIMGWQILVVVPLFFTTISTNYKSNINYIMFHDFFYIDGFKRLAYICYIASFYLFLLLIRIDNKKPQEIMKENKQINS